MAGLFTGLAIGFMAVVHAYHILYNLTTVEMHTIDTKVRIILLEQIS